MGLTADSELSSLHNILDNNGAKVMKSLCIFASFSLLNKFLGMRLLEEKDMHVFIFDNISLKYPL